MGVSLPGKSVNINIGQRRSSGNIRVNHKHRELFVDNFAGGGGASSGIEAATGMSVDIAVNHDDDAVAMHMVNHPFTEHYCESVWDVDPEAATGGLPVALAWFSPDCKHFSRAKGAKPVDKNIRGLAWSAVRWAKMAKPRVIALENVPEFVEWGPVLKNGIPCRRRKGQTFKSFRRTLEALGYEVDYRELMACDYGSPTIRKRFFLVARCDGKAIVWPKPTHGAPTNADVIAGRLKPWRTTAECIDWSIAVSSILGRKRPLVKNTLRRIARGIQRFVIDAADPFVVKLNHTSNRTKYDCFRGQGIHEPIQTITQTPGFALVKPFVARQFGASIGHSVLAPMGTITCGGGGKSQLVNAIVKPVNGSSYEKHPFVVRQFGTGVARSVQVPMATVMADGGGGKSQLIDVTVWRPAAEHANVRNIAHVCKHFGGGYTGAGSDMRSPVPTITAVDHSSVVMSKVAYQRAETTYGSVIKYFGTNIGHPVDHPIQTLTSKSRFGLLTIKAVKPPLTDDELYSAWWIARLMEDHGPKEEAKSVIPGPRRAWVNVKDGGVLVDIGMRMFEPHELFKAQGFREDYIIDRDIDGNPYPKYKQVARCGNSVPPQLAEAIVRANLPEYCNGSMDLDEISTDLGGSIAIAA